MAAVAEAARYKELLARYEPAPIKSREENQQALEVLSTLMAKGEENLSADEQKFVELLGMLISQFEKTAYPAPKGAPADVLRELMRARGMRPKDLWPLFGSKGITSEVLRGKRGISKERAKALAEMFCVSVELFI
jgi:HTH-type transcriptional regulator / antitoxin HigA